RHVVRDGRLGEAEARGEVANTDGGGRLPQRCHHGQPGRVSKRSHELCAPFSPVFIDWRERAADAALADHWKPLDSHGDHGTVSIDECRWVREVTTMSEIKEAVRSRYAGAAKQIAVLPVGSTAGCCAVDGPDCGCAGSYSTEAMKEIGLARSEERRVGEVWLASLT